MALITIENYHDCYDYGCRVSKGDMTIAEAVDCMSALGMNAKSARPYITCVEKMKNGEAYQSTVKMDAVTYFLTQIYEESGVDGLKKALNSLKGHLEYQEGKNSLPSLWKVYEDFSEIL